MTKTILSKRFLVFVLVGYLFSPISRVEAEVECVSDVSFKVAPHEKVQEKAEGGAAAAPRDVFFASINARAANEEAGKAELKKKADISREKAMAHCKAAFENKASCIATKYSIMESVINTLDFKARTDLQRAIQSDCERQTGICIEAVASEARCKEAASAATAPAEAKPEGEEPGKTAEEGKDAKGGAAKKEEKKKK